MSTATIHENVVYLSGWTAVKHTDQGIRGQAEELFAELDKILQACGSDRQHLLSVEVYLADVRQDFDEFNKIYEEWLKDCHKPSRICVQATLIDEAWLVEMMVTAAVVKRKP